MAAAPTVRFTRALAAITQTIGCEDVDGELCAFLFATLREGCTDEAAGEGFADEVLASFVQLDALDGKRRGALVQAVVAAATAGLARGGGAQAAPAAPTEMEKALLEMAGGGGGGGGGAPAAERAPAAPLARPACAAAFAPPPHLLAPAAALCALLPQLPLEAACIALERGGGGDAERAAAWLLAGGAALEAEVVAAAAAAAERRGAAAAARAAAEEAAARAEGAALRATLRRFHEVADEAGKSHAPKVGFEAAPKKGTSVLRYVEGVPTYVKPGTKVLVEKAAEPPAGTVVALKVKKKGQGGASPNFK
jgi:hypothetical protein